MVLTLQGQIRVHMTLKLQYSRLLTPVITLIMTVRIFALDCIVATSFDKAFLDKWTFTSSRIPPHLADRDTVYAELPLNITVLFKEYIRDFYGATDVSYSCSVLKPDGSLMFDTTGLKAVDGSMLQDTIPLLGTLPSTVLFTPTDRPGRYRVRVTAYDSIIGVKKTLYKTVILADYPKITSHRFDDISFNVWIHSYCLDPDPGRAIAAFSWFIENDMSNNDEIFWPVFYFFQCLFHDNPALARKLAGTIPSSSRRLKEYTVFLFRAIQIDRKTVGVPIPDTLWNKFDKAASSGFRDPFTDAFTVGSNRLLEFGFYYYGTYALIRFLIDCLAITTPDGYAEFVKNCSTYHTHCPEDFSPENAVQLSSDARQIIKKAYIKHPLVNRYCNYALEKDHLNNNAKKNLREIIAALKQ